MECQWPKNQIYNPGFRSELGHRTGCPLRRSQRRHRQGVGGAHNEETTPSSNVKFLRPLGSHVAGAYNRETDFPRLMVQKCGVRRAPARRLGDTLGKMGNTPTPPTGYPHSTMGSDYRQSQRSNPCILRCIRESLLGCERFDVASVGRVVNIGPGEALLHSRG
jgi:hypothetical protein